MRSVSSIAVLAAALLANQALAKPILIDRDVLVHNVLITEEIVVTKYADGFLKTGKPKPVGTKTYLDTPEVQTIIRPVSTVEEPSSSSTPEPEPTSSSLPSSGGLFIERPAPSSVKVEEVVAPAPSTTPAKVEVPAPVVAPTTLATVASPPAAPVVSSAAPVSSSPPSTPSGGKRGIAYNDPNLLKPFAGSSASWCYNWGGSTNDVPKELGLEFVPTLWGLGSHADNWNRYADTAIAAGSTHLFSFNEPDHGEQAMLSPSAAAAGYQQYMQPYAGKAKLGAPSVTNGGGEMGLTWLGNFLNACSGCTIDFVNVHWYNGGDVAAFKAHMQQAYDVGGKRPVWITEFQAPGSIPEQVAFLAELLPWLDSQDWIARYSLFMASEGLMISGGALSEVGKAFIA